MPSNAVKEARTAIDFMMRFIPQFLGAGTNEANAASTLFKFLGGGGTGNFESVVGDLNKFKAFVEGQTPGLGSMLGPELRQILNSVNFNTPAMEAMIGDNGKTADSQWIRDITQAAVRARDPQGFSPEMRQMQDLAYVLINNGSGMSPEMQQASNAALSMLLSGGRTAETGQGIGQFMSMLGSGGRDPFTSQLSSTGQGLMANGGMTPQMEQFLGEIMGSFQSGGMTPEARRLFNEVMEIVESGGQGGALLPMDTVREMAREDARVASRSQAQQVARQVNNRMGNAMGAGFAFNPLASFSDEAIQAEAKAARDATTSQQTLQLQQLMGAMGTGADITKAAQTLLAALSGSGADIFRSASSNLATGAGLMSDAEKIAATRFGTATQGLDALLAQELGRLNAGGNIFSDVGNLALNRMQTGADIFGRNEQQAQSAMLAFGDLLNRVGQTETSRQLGGIQGLMGLLGIGNSVGQFGQQMDLSSFDSKTKALLQSLGIKTDAASGEANMIGNAGQGLNQNANLFLQMLPTLFSQTGGLQQSLVQAAMQPGFWSQLAQTAVGGLMGGLTGGLGGAITGGLFGGGGGSTRAANNDLSRPGEWGRF